MPDSRSATTSGCDGPTNCTKFGMGESEPWSHCARRTRADSRDDRWRDFSLTEVKEKDFKLDGFKWLKEESLEDADDLIDDLKRALKVAEKAVA